MRFKTIVIGLLLGMLFYSMSSCRTAQQKKERDLEKFTELSKKHPDFIKNDSSLSETEHDLDSSGFALETDSAAFRELLQEYREALDSLELIVKSNEHDSNTVEVRNILRGKVKTKFNDLTGGSLKPFSHVIVDKDSIVSLALHIDPKKKLVTYEGTYKKEKTTIVRTVKQLVPGEITNWQAIKKVWWGFALCLLIIALLIIFK